MSKWQDTLTLLRGPGDDERMAGLLLVTHIDNGGQDEAERLGQVLEALGFKFIKRLLGTSSLAVYQSIGLGIASRMIWILPEVAKRDDIGEVIQLSVQILFKGGEEVENAMRCLVGTCCNVDLDRNRRIAAEAGAVEAVSKVLGKEGLSELAIRLLWCLVEHTYDEPATVAASSSAASSLASFLVDQKPSEVTEFAYGTLALLVPLTTSSTWLDMATTALNNILRSRVTETTRIAGLELAAAMLEHVGGEWADEQLAELLVRMAAIEASTSLHIARKRSVDRSIAVSFRILEASISLLIGDWEGMSGQVLLRIRTALVDVFGVVLEFLEDPLPDITEAACRALGVYLAVDPVSLTDRFLIQLPHLLTHIRYFFPCLIAMMPQHGEQMRDSGVFEATCSWLSSHCDIIGLAFAVEMVESVEKHVPAALADALLHYNYDSPVTEMLAYLLISNHEPKPKWRRRAQEAAAKITPDCQGYDWASPWIIQ